MLSFAIDLDGVIGTNPDFFKWFTFILHKNGHWIDIVSSRNPKRIVETEEELKHWGITYNNVHHMYPSMPRDFKTQAKWKLDTINRLGTDIWMDNEFKIYEKLCNVDFSKCKAERITI